METYCGLAQSGQQSGRYPGLCVQAVGSGLCGQRLRARDESALEVAPPAYGVHDDALYKLTAFTFTFDMAITCQHIDIKYLSAVCLAKLIHETDNYHCQSFEEASLVALSQIS